MRKTGYFVYKDWLIWVPLSLAGTWSSYICLNSENIREQVGNLGGEVIWGRWQQKLFNREVTKLDLRQTLRAAGCKKHGLVRLAKKAAASGHPPRLCPWPRAPQQGSVCLIVTFQKYFLYSTLGIPLLKLSPNWHRNTFVCLNIGWLSKDAHFFLPL